MTISKKFDYPKKIVFKQWQASKEYTRKLVIKNLDSKLQRFTYDLPKSKIFLLDYPTSICLSTGMSYTIIVKFKPKESTFYEERLVFHCNDGTFHVDLVAELPKLHLKSQRSLDFGCFSVLSTVVSKLSLRNDGDLNLGFNFQSQQTDSFKVWVEPPTGEIPPNEEIELDVYLTCYYATVLHLDLNSFYHSTDDLNLKKRKRFVHLFGVSRYPHLILTVSGTHENVLNFGVVGFGSSGHKDLDFSLSNPTLVDSSFVIAKNPDSVFSLTSYKGTVPKGGTLKIFVRFNPFQPHWKTCEILYIKIIGGSTIKLYVTGESQGPTVIIKPSVLDFGEVFVGSSVIKQLHIRNIGNSRARFRSDVVKSYNAIFSCNEETGIIDPMSSTISSFKFNALKIGHFQERIYFTLENGVDEIPTLHARLVDEWKCKVPFSDRQKTGDILGKCNKFSPAANFSKMINFSDEILKFNDKEFTKVLTIKNNFDKSLSLELSIEANVPSLYNAKFNKNEDKIIRPNTSIECSVTLNKENSAVDDFLLLKFYLINDADEERLIPEFTMLYSKQIFLLNIIENPLLDRVPILVSVDKPCKSEQKHYITSESDERKFVYIDNSSDKNALVQIQTTNLELENQKFFLFLKPNSFEILSVRFPIKQAPSSLKIQNKIAESISEEYSFQTICNQVEAIDECPIVIRENIKNSKDIIILEVVNRVFKLMVGKNTVSGPIDDTFEVQESEYVHKSEKIVLSLKPSPVAVQLKNPPIEECIGVIFLVNGKPMNFNLRFMSPEAENNSLLKGFPSILNFGNMLINTYQQKFLKICNKSNVTLVFRLDVEPKEYINCFDNLEHDIVIRGKSVIDFPVKLRALDDKKISITLYGKVEGIKPTERFKLATVELNGVSSKLSVIDIQMAGRSKNELIDIFQIREFNRRLHGNEEDEEPVYVHFYLKPYGDPSSLLKIFVKNTGMVNTSFRLYFENEILYGKHDGDQVLTIRPTSSCIDPGEIKPINISINHSIRGQYESSLVFEVFQGLGVIPTVVKLVIVTYNFESSRHMFNLECWKYLASPAIESKTTIENPTFTIQVPLPPAFLNKEGITLELRDSNIECLVDKGYVVFDFLSDFTSKVDKRQMELILKSEGHEMAKISLNLIKRGQCTVDQFEICNDSNRSERLEISTDFLDFGCIPNNSHSSRVIELTNRSKTKSVQVSIVLPIFLRDNISVNVLPALPVVIEPLKSQLYFVSVEVLCEQENTREFNFDFEILSQDTNGKSQTKLSKKSLSSLMGINYNATTGHRMFVSCKVFSYHLKDQSLYKGSEFQMNRIPRSMYRYQEVTIKERKLILNIFREIFDEILNESDEQECKFSLQLYKSEERLVTEEFFEQIFSEIISSTITSLEQVSE